MTKMQEAFEKWFVDTYKWEPEFIKYKDSDEFYKYATDGIQSLFIGFEAGYQAAIADIKARGVIAKVAYPVDTIPYAHLVRNCDLSALVGIKLYKLPEDV